jgi:hypothetical protein
MQQLEPTYLRYVYDGLSKGSISPNNPTSLPIGFIGLFEDEFPSSMPVIKRVSILNRLALWALLKGPASIEMVAEILDEHPDTTKALIDKYSKWFNSPDPGKYILYHDRLRTYLLQKLSDHELKDLNETLIIYLENELKRKGLKEAESYALEHLSTHMVIESQMGNNYEGLHELVNKVALWKRQINASNEYKWSQRAIQYGIKEGARRHQETNTLLSTVNSVKLMQEEQNSTKQILNLLKEGDYQTAIERVLFFSGIKLITICLLIINELLINEKQSDDYKSKVFNEVLEIIKKNDIKQSNFPVILIYKFYLEFKRLNLDYSVILKKYSFDCYDTICLLKFDEIDINEIEYLVENFIHLSYYPDIYIAISKFYHEKNDKNKIDFYLKKALVAIQNIPVYMTESMPNPEDMVMVKHEDYFQYYREKLMWKIRIGLIYFDINDLKTAKQILDDIFLLVEEISNSKKLAINLEYDKHNVAIYPKTWFAIYHLCFLLGSYERVINSKKFNEFVNVKNTRSMAPEQILSLSRILLIKEDYVQYENFINHIEKKNFSKIIIIDIDYFITLCKLNELEKIYLQEQKIIKKINSLEFGQIKFDALIYFAETLFLAEKFFEQKNEDLKKNIKTLANKIVEYFNYNLNCLSDKNTHFYFKTISNLITLLLNANKITEALEKYDIYFNEIIKNNIQNPKEKHKYFRLLFDSILTFNYKSPDLIIKKAEEIINDKHYYSDEEKLEFFYDIKNKTFKSLLEKGYHEEAHIFAKKHNIKLYLFNNDGIDLKFNIIKKADLFERNENLQSFSTLTNSQSSNEYFSLELLQSLDSNKLFKIIDYIRNDDLIPHSLEINILIDKGYNKQIQRFLVARLNNKLITFKYQRNANFYKSITGKIVKKPSLTRALILALEYKNDLIDFNYIILNELSYVMNWKDLEILVNLYKYVYNLQIPPSRNDISNISSANKLVLEISYFNVKLKLLLKKLFVDNDPILINKLFEICSKLSENFIRDSKVSNIFGSYLDKDNHSAYAYLQFSNVLNQVGLHDQAIKAITKAHERSIDAKFKFSKIGSPTNTNIIKVFIHICMSGLNKSETLNQFDKIIDFYNIYIETFDEDSPEQVLYLLIEPLVQLGETSKGIHVANMILKIIENIPVKHTKWFFVDENGLKSPNTSFIRKQKSLYNISYFYYAIGDSKKGDEYFNMLSETDLTSMQSDPITDELFNGFGDYTFYEDDRRKVGFDKKEILNKYKNKIFPKYEKKTTENIVLKENEIEFNGLVYNNVKDKKIMESNFDFSFTKNNIEFEFLSKNQNPKDVSSYLFYKAKMACFFETKKDEEKLNLISEVINIDDWRNKSADLRNN